MADPAQNVGFGTPFEAQIEFLRQKLRLPTERWDDIQRAAHDRAFIVAGAAKADLLADLQQAVLKNAEQGLGVRAFQKDFRAIVAKHGWTGWKGEDSKSGEAWRARTIYQTNMATSYAAGRLKQFKDPEYVRLRPYWRYIHSEAVTHPRPQHLAWHGLTLPHDHAFWLTHFAPNGWGCQCRITPVSRAEGEASARAGLGDPPDDWDAIDPKTGAQVGIDKGFDYTPGAGVDTPLRQMVQDKLITYPPAITRALTVDVNRYVNATQKPADFVREVLADGGRTDPLWLGFVENPAAVQQVCGVDVNGFIVLVPADAARHIDAHHGWDGAGQRPAEPQDYEQLMRVLSDPDRLRKGQAEKGKERLVAEKIIEGELFRAVFELRAGKKNRALALVTLAIKTARK